MKKAIRLTLLSFLFFIDAKNTQAQMDTLFTDTVLIEVPFQHMLDSPNWYSFATSTFFSFAFITLSFPSCI